jgi:tetratricopeptide (TPR) repeat protein
LKYKLTEKMKKIVAFLFVVIPAMAFAQIKPNVGKAEKAWRDGKYDEAKSIIDATTGSQEFMVDKKGKPSKQAAKAWYMKGVIYMSIDTTKKQQYKSLDANAFTVAKEAFSKCQEIDKGETASFINDLVNPIFPVPTDNVSNNYAAFYWNKAIVEYNEKKDVASAFAYSERTLYFREDTLVLLYAGGVFAPGAKEYDKGLDMLNRYVKAGGKTAEAYTMMASIYKENKKDNASAMKILQEAKVKFPTNKDVRIMELNIYLAEKKYDVARDMVEGELKSEPNNKDNYFLYGQLNREMGDSDKAKEAFKKFMELDPTSFEGAAELANLYWADAKSIKNEMGKLGSSKADMEKLKKLDVTYVERLKIYVPYIEACEKLSPDDVTVQYSLLNVYGDLGEDAKVARVKKKLKSLGEEIN